MKATQQRKIFNYCQEHGSITIREAFGLDIKSPSKRISEMRHSGVYDVKSIEEVKVKDNGETVRYKRYFIHKGSAAL